MLQPALALLLLTAVAEPFPDSAVMAILGRMEGGVPGPVLCLDIDGAVPAPALLARLQKLQLPVVPPAECEINDDQVEHRPSGAAATWLSLSGFRSAGRLATATISSYSGPLASGVWRIQLRWVGDRWKFVSSKVELISRVWQTAPTHG